jgi:hypothetical protein
MEKRLWNVRVPTFIISTEQKTHTQYTLGQLGCCAWNFPGFSDTPRPQKLPQSKTDQDNWLVWLKFWPKVLLEVSAGHTLFWNFLMYTVQWLLVIFTRLCNHCNYLLPEHSHHPKTNSLEVSSNFPLDMSLETINPLSISMDLPIWIFDRHGIK